MAEMGPRPPDGAPVTVHPHPTHLRRAEERASPRGRVRAGAREPAGGPDREIVPRAGFADVPSDWSGGPVWRALSRAAASGSRRGRRRSSGGSTRRAGGTPHRGRPSGPRGVPARGRLEGQVARSPLDPERGHSGRRLAYGGQAEAVDVESTRRSHRSGTAMTCGKGTCWRTGRVARRSARSKRSPARST